LAVCGYFTNLDLPEAQGTPSNEMTPSTFTIFLSVITTIVGAAVGWVGFQQFRLARERFKLDLFQKRFAIFEATQKFLPVALYAPFTHEQLIKFMLDTDTAVFLFDDDIEKYLTEIQRRATNLWAIHEEQKDLEPASPKRMELGRKREANRDELTELQNQLRDKFSPYLKFKNWK
jgi:hypothetical protein